MFQLSIANESIRPPIISYRNPWLALSHRFYQFWSPLSLTRTYYDKKYAFRSDPNAKNVTYTSVTASHKLIVLQLYSRHNFIALHFTNAIDWSVQFTVAIIPVFNLEKSSNLLSFGKILKCSFLYIPFPFFQSYRSFLN